MQNVSRSLVQAAAAPPLPRSLANRRSVNLHRVCDETRRGKQKSRKRKINTDADSERERNVPRARARVRGPSRN